MENLDPKLVLALILLFLLLLLMLYMWLRSMIERARSEIESDSDEQMSLEDLRKRREQEKATKVALLKETLPKADPLLLKQLVAMSGIATKELEDRSHEAAVVERLANRLNLQDIQSLHIATTTKNIKSTATTSVSIERTPVPTNDIRPQNLDDMSNIGNLTLDSLAQTEEDFYTRLATGDLQVLESYEKVVKRGLKAMVLDVSNSMDSPMQSGVNKSVMARGATYKLISNSDAAKTDFMLRFFDGDTHPLLRASTEDQRLKLMQSVRNNGFSGGGTNIVGAITQMAKDIRRLPDIDEADITLITDGQDDNCNSAEELRSILGPKIKLHVIAIGQENPVLREVAATYTKLS